MKRINVLTITLGLITLLSFGGNSAKAQDVTLVRLNEIVDGIFDGMSADDNVYSREFGVVLRTFENTKYQGDMMGMPGDLFVDESVRSMGIGGEEMTLKARRSYELIRGSEKEAIVKVTLDEDFGEAGSLHHSDKLCLVKENGVWVLDDLLYGGDNDWSAKKMTKEESMESITAYKGHMLDDDERGPFKMCVMIHKYPDENNVTVVSGAYKFDSEDEYDWHFFSEGTLKDGEVSLKVEDEEKGDQCFYWTVNPESKEVEGEWQAYYPDGHIAFSREFVMTILQ